MAATLQPGTSYITIVREPIDLFESLWSYAGINDFLLLFWFDLPQYKLLSLRHVCLLSYGPRVVCPVSQERYWRGFSSNFTFANSSSSQATWLRELIETWVGTKCSGTPVFQWRPWTMSPPFKQRLLIHTHYGDFLAFWLEIVSQSLSWFFEDWGDGGHVWLGDGRGEVGRVHGASEGSALLGV